jgi:hypothetical protein
MKDDVYLIITKRGVKKLTKRMPTLGAHEYACKLTVSIPDSYFNRPMTKVLLTLDEQQIIEPDVQIEQKS